MNDVANENEMEEMVRQNIINQAQMWAKYYVLQGRSDVADKIMNEAFSYQTPTQKRIAETNARNQREFWERFRMCNPDVSLAGF